MKKPKILFFVTEDWYFVSHRLALAIAAKKAGYIVLIATNIGRHGDLIRSHGLEIIHYKLPRRGGNPFVEIWRAVKLYNEISPNIVHHVALVPVVYGTIAAKLTRVPQIVNAISGFGWLFTTKGLWPQFLKLCIRFFLKIFLSFQNVVTIVQNPEDLRILESLGIPSRSIKLIRSAGVNTKEFSPNKDVNYGPVKVVMVSRLIWPKGVGEFMAAAKILKTDKVKAQFILIGEPDIDNPTSVEVKVLSKWSGEKNFEWWGRRDDISSLLSQFDILCLPSYYGEGIPKVLIEGASCGLPLITTNTPGCREVVEDGVNGIFVPPRDPEALALAIRRLILDSDLRDLMGHNGRKKVLNEFSEEFIIDETMKVYKKIL